VKKLIKLIKKIMTGYDIDTLVSIKDHFQGNNFQWVKTTDRSKLGKVVRVTDIVPGGRGAFIAQLSDGTRIPTDQLTSNLMMLMDDQPALSISEIMSINSVPSLSEGISVDPNLPQEVKAEISTTPITRQDPVIARAASPSSTDPGDLFGMFSLEQTDLALTVSIKLPAKNLLKMMYSNSQNKEEFLNKLSAYINSNVTADSIKESMRRALDPDKKKKSDATSA
jgi:hypothetical protein